jgi:adenine deaminase
MDVALGSTPPDVVVTGGTIVNVLSGDFHQSDILIKGDRIASLSEPGACTFKGVTVVDACGRFLVPGFIDPHMHIESSGITVAEFARAVVARGVTSVTIDPHEFGNIVGVAGIRALFDSARGLPLRLLLRVPARVPELSTELETPGARIDQATTADMLKWPEAVCLAGDINPELILRKDPEQLWRIDQTIAEGKTVSGYVPTMSIDKVNALVAAGLEDTHVPRNVSELVSNLRLGLHVLLTPRPGRFEIDDFRELASWLRDKRIDGHRISLCTDDVLVHELRHEGHLDARIKMAIAGGIPPLTAIQMATANTARLLRIERDLGSLAAGRIADIAVLDDINQLTVNKVIFAGRLVYEDGAFLSRFPEFDWPEWCKSTIRPFRPLSGRALALACDGCAQWAACRVLVPSYPKAIVIDRLPVIDGHIVPSVAGDKLAVAVLERHQGTGNIGKGFVSGIGLQRGAIASSINHNCHHLFAVGADFDDMATALNHLARIGGGYVAVSEGNVVGEIALPIIGMISERSIENLTDEFIRFEATIREKLGWKPQKRPLYMLNFLCSPVVPRYGFTDKGLVDARELRVLEVVVDQD